MKKTVLAILVVLGGILNASAQKVAVVDMDYILKSIPQYEAANDQLSQLSTKWQKEIEAQQAEVQTLYKNYQTELVFLTPEMKKQREDEIIAKERAIGEKKKKYFGAEGELYKKRESLMKPIQTYTGRDIQRYSGVEQYEEIRLDTRQKLQRRHHLRFTENRYKR